MLERKGKTMSANQWRSSLQPALTPMELARLTEEKAQRFAESPPAGYLAGYSPHHQPYPHSVDDRVSHVTGWNNGLSWLYAVAEQDIPDNSYRWGIVELPEGHFKLVVDPVEGAGD
jgi:hypothetical protein